MEQPYEVWLFKGQDDNLKRILVGKYKSLQSAMRKRSKLRRDNVRGDILITPCSSMISD
jgi:hypothetical protein